MNKRGGWRLGRFGLFGGRGQVLNKAAELRVAGPAGASGVDQLGQPPLALRGLDQLKGHPFIVPGGRQVVQPAVQAEEQELLQFLAGKGRTQGLGERFLLRAAELEHRDLVDAMLTGMRTC